MHVFMNYCFYFKLKVRRKNFPLKSYFFQIAQKNFRLETLVNAFYYFTRSGLVQNERAKYITNFFHRKALAGVTFCSVIWPLVTFGENYFQKFPLHVIPILMIPVSSLYHVPGPSHKGSDKQTQTNFGYCYNYIVTRGSY